MTIRKLIVFWGMLFTTVAYPETFPINYYCCTGGNDGLTCAEGCKGEPGNIADMCAVANHLPLQQKGISWECFNATLNPQYTPSASPYYVAKCSWTTENCWKKTCFTAHEELAPLEACEAFDCKRLYPDWGPYCSYP